MTRAQAVARRRLLTAATALALSAGSLVVYQATDAWAAVTVTSVTPKTGPTTGGTSVTIIGSGFTSSSAVTFGGSNATSKVFVTSTKIVAVTPAHAAGAVAVVVGGTTLANGFTYYAKPTVSAVSPSNGPQAGGQKVTVTGTGFTTTGTTVSVGGVAGTGVTVASSTSLTFTTPKAPSVGSALDIRVTTAGGTSATGAGDHYTYDDNIVVTPNTGAKAANVPVTITGVGFAGFSDTTTYPNGVDLCFGTTQVAAANWVVMDDNTAYATAPTSASDGPVLVWFSNEDGTNPHCDLGTDPSVTKVTSASTFTFADY